MGGSAIGAAGGVFCRFITDVLMCQLNHLFEDPLKELQMLLQLDFESVEKQAHF